MPEQELATGFAAVMASLEQATPDELETLDRVADRAEVGLDAYALGMEHLARGAQDQARERLEQAARYGVTSAERILAGIREGRLPDDLPGRPCALDLVPAPDRTDDAGDVHASAAEMMEAAVAHAAQLREEAEADAERLVAEARNWADRMRTAAVKHAEALAKEAHRNAQQRKDTLSSEAARLMAVAKSTLEALEHHRDGVGQAIAGARERVDTLTQRTERVNDLGNTGASPAA
ncbi:hypothetical protein [Streptomyces sp. NPDC048172]|uniref:hypothetical protein n=1 Tax=Streptomyces sp. NPDC048172 TaxID=3365505 RepID=UPI00371BD56E